MKLKILPFLLLPISLAGMNAPGPRSSAGVIEQNLERIYNALTVAEKNMDPILQVDIPKEAFRIPEEESGFIKKVLFNGNTILPDEYLEYLAEPLLEKKVSMQEVQTLLLQIQEKYVNEGYILTRVLTPTERLEKDVLTIEIVEGKLGKITIANNRNYQTKFILGYFNRFKGLPVNYYSILRQLILINENIDIHVGGILKKGDRTGEVDLALNVTDTYPFDAYLGYNNCGSDVVSRTRIGSRLELGNLFGQGSIITLGGISAIPIEELYFHSTRYSVPINFSGTYLGAAYLYSNFSVSQLRDSNIRGKSQVAEINFLQKISRTRRLHTNAMVDLIYKNVKNYSLGTKASADYLREVKVGCNVDYSDKLQGRNYGAISGTIGIPDFLGGSKRVNPSSSCPCVGGRFFKVNAEYRRIQSLPWYSVLTFYINGQYAFEKLTLPEQFLVGGYGTVRGYQVATGIGDHGYFANLEYWFPLPGLATQRVLLLREYKQWKDFFAFALFVDNGLSLEDTDFYKEPRCASLTSVGVGLRLFNAGKFDIALDWAFPLTQTKSQPSSIFYIKINTKPF